MSACAVCTSIMRAPCLHGMHLLRICPPALHLAARTQLLVQSMEPGQAQGGVGNAAAAAIPRLQHELLARLSLQPAAAAPPPPSNAPASAPIAPAHPLLGGVASQPAPVAPHTPSTGSLARTSSMEVSPPAAGGTAGAAALLPLSMSQSFTSQGARRTASQLLPKSQSQVWLEQQRQLQQLYQQQQRAGAGAGTASGMGSVELSPLMRGASSSAPTPHKGRRRSFLQLH